VIGRLEMPFFFRFLFGIADAALLTLPYVIWWWANRRIPLADRAYGFVLIVAGGAVAGLVCHPSLAGWGLLMSGVPIVLTIWSAWLLLVRVTGLSWFHLGSVAAVLLGWAPFTLVRMEGLNSELQADLHWRWTPTAEEKFLAERQSADAATPALSSSTSALIALPGDWTGFRGPERDGVIRGVEIATDWNSRPPRQLWRQRVGPAWSSVIVIGDRLFTQEQRGEQETVVCYDATTGRQLWVHADIARFYEAVSGPGPRATPTFAASRLYTLGGTGLLNCLDATTGQRHWMRDITADAGAKAPMWGYSGSPLVVNGLVIVYSGGPGDKNLLAYRAETGEPVWTAPAGQLSYSSPQLATVAGKPQVLIQSDHGLTAVEPETGAVLWQHGLVMSGAPRCVQAHVDGDQRILAGGLEGLGTALVNVIHEGSAWQVTPQWNAPTLKIEFSDLVMHQGHAYGFDVSHFTCIDLAKGKRCWKGERYGRGQVMLLADQGLLLVLSETGDAILLPANPQRAQELGHFHALDGKTWNHPVIAHGRLFVRNAEEMACYELRGQG
jgi:hypothetical protein